MYKLSLRILLIISLITLTGCANLTPGAENIEPNPFKIKVSAVASFGMKWGFKKSWIVSSTEQVTVSAQAWGRITQIDKKIGNKINIGQQVLAMEDTNWTISSAVRKAGVGLESAQDNRAIQNLNFEKSLFDNQIGLQRNKITSIATRFDVDKQEEQIQKNLNDNDLNVTWSNLSLQLKKLQNDLEKAQLDYQTKLDSDVQTILNFFGSVKLIWTDLNNLFADTIQASDLLLGYTSANRNANDGFESMLGNKDFYSKARAEAALGTALSAYDNFKMIVSDINADTINPLLKSYQKGIESVNALLTSINTLLIMTQPGGPLPESLYNGYKAQFDGYKSKASGISSSVNAQLNGINTFFATYKQNQESALKWIESLKQQIELSTKGVNDTQYNTKLSSDRQLSNLESTIKNQDLTDKSNDYTADYLVQNAKTTLDNLNNAVANAQISYEEATFWLSKFTVESPIWGTITDVLVTKGQEVNPGTPLFTVVNTNLRQIDLDITAGEKELIIPGQAVEINQWGIIGKGIVESVSEVADRNFGYKVVVIITEGSFDIGSSVAIQFTWSLGENIVIPLNSVSIVDNGRWVVQLWKSWKIIPTTVSLWSLAGQYIIVTDGLSIDDMIIISDISNFDSEKMQAVAESN